MGQNESNNILEEDKYVETKSREITITKKKSFDLKELSSGKVIFFPHFNRAIVQSRTPYHHTIEFYNLESGEIIEKKELERVVPIDKSDMQLLRWIYDYGVKEEFILVEWLHKYRKEESFFLNIYSIHSLEQSKKRFPIALKPYHINVLPNDPTKVVMITHGEVYGSLLGSVYIYDLVSGQSKKIFESTFMTSSKSVFSPSFKSCIYVNTYLDSNNVYPIYLLDCESEKKVINIRFEISSYMWYVFPFKNQKNEECILTTGDSTEIHFFNAVQKTKLKSITVRDIIQGFKNPINMITDLRPNSMWLISGDTLLFTVMSQLSCIKLIRKEKSVSYKVLFKNKELGYSARHYLIDSKLHIAASDEFRVFSRSGEKEVSVVKITGVVVDRNFGKSEQAGNDLVERTLFLRENSEWENVEKKKMYFKILLKNMKIEGILRISLL